MKHVPATVTLALALATVACGQARPASSHVKSDDSREISVPRALHPTIKVDDERSLERYLTALVEEYEGLPANVANAPADKDLEVSFDGDEKPCTLRAHGTRLDCEVDYLQDRWNGQMTAQFTVSHGRAVTLTKADFDGSM